MIGLNNQQISQTTALMNERIFPKQPIDGRLLASEDGMLNSNVQKKDQATYVSTVISGPETISESARLTVAGKLFIYSARIILFQKMSSVQVFDSVCRK